MASSVNVPTNPKIKEQDVNQKLQLFGIYSGMSSHLPMALVLTPDDVCCRSGRVDQNMSLT